MMLLVSVTGCCCTRPAPMRAAHVVKPTTMPCWDQWWRSWRQSDHNCVSSTGSARQQNRSPSAVTSPLVLGESAYATAERLHADCDERAIDYWAQAIAWTGEAMQQNDCGQQGGCCQRSSGVRYLAIGASPHCTCACEGSNRAAQIHKSAMIRILSLGQTYGRLDPSSHLQINGMHQSVRIPIIHHGFPWKRTDFQRLIVLEPPADSAGNVPGRGVPLIVLSRRKPIEREVPPSSDEYLDDDRAILDDRSFVDSQTPFAATALLDLPVSLFQDVAFSDDEAVGEEAFGSLTLVNPLVIDPGTNGGIDDGPAIAQCPAMPLDYAREASDYDALTAFLIGDNGIDRPRLRFFEPYQADKIPLLLVHGLLSDPATFLQMAEVVRADPYLRTRYQIWVFRYPTGDNVLNSAAALRSQLARASAGYTQTHGSAPPLPAVIVGHSMGGLISKLQVTDSGDRLWRSIADAPFEQLQGSPKLLEHLQQSFFFSSNPNISRVVYIATPHQGSPWASRCIGRIGSTLAGVLGQGRSDYQAVVRNNPGVFSADYSEAFPSSVELMRPSSDLLRALAATPSSPNTIVNSIIGDSCWLPRSGPSDGVVSIASAYRANAESTNLVDATHTKILESPEAQRVLLEILRVHLATSNGMNAEVPIEAPLQTDLPIEWESSQESETAIEMKAPIEFESPIELESPIEFESPNEFTTSLELLPALP